MITPLSCPVHLGNYSSLLRTLPLPLPSVYAVSCKSPLITFFVCDVHESHIHTSYNCARSIVVEATFLVKLDTRYLPFTAMS